MPVVGAQTSQNYPTLETVLSLIRGMSNDAFAGNTNTAGEGQVLTDLYQASTSYNPQLLTCFNAAIRAMYTKLRNVKFKGLLRDNYILTGIPVINGPLGSGVVDPTVQTYLTWGFFFDGTNQNTSLTLPPDLMQPLRIWERQSGSQDPLVPMREARNGLEPGNQTDRLSIWEWREGRINFNGATVVRDIRLKYQAFLPQFFPSNPVPANYFTTTQIPVFDCENYLAYETLCHLSVGLNPAIFPTLKAMADDALYDLRNEEVRRMQSTNYTRPAWDDGDNTDEFTQMGM